MSSNIPIKNIYYMLSYAFGALRHDQYAPLAAEEYRALTRPLPAERMTVRPVNRFVSNSRNDGPQCLEPQEDAPPELNLGFT